MYELQQQLEYIFKGKILLMRTTSMPNMAATPSQLGMLYTQLGRTSFVVTINLVHDQLLHQDIESARLSPMRAFEGITTNAYVTNMVHETSMSPTALPILTIEFKIFNHEEFLKDVNSYCYQHFSDQFNRDLDKVLEEE